MVIGKIKYNDRFLNVVKTKHLYDVRGKEGINRDRFINDSRYMEIIGTAIKNGLKSFGLYRKEDVVITFKDSWNLWYGVLVVVENNDIVIKSVYNSKIISFQKFFKRVHNRINMFNYVMQVMSKEEYLVTGKKIREKKIDLSIPKEDDNLFKEYTNIFGVKKI